MLDLITYNDICIGIAVEFNPREGLKGWLKVPKGGRVKKGWRQRYAVVRDFKIYMYDRDKDVGTMEGSFIVDIRYVLLNCITQNISLSHFFV